MSLALCNLPQIVLLAALLIPATLLAAEAAARGGEAPLLAGWASVDITPPRSVALVGQLHRRISTAVRDPLTATALALETRHEDGRREQAIMVSCDVIGSPIAIQRRLQERAAASLPDFTAAKLFMNATHTHTAPGFIDSTFKGRYDTHDLPDVMKPSKYAEFFLDRVAGAVEKAWNGRQPAAMSWAMGQAVVGFNRRASYFDGTSVMYGKTAVEGFSHVEGYEDHSVDILLLWSPQGRLSGLVINLACPSQETEHLNEISADFWHDVRQELRRRHGEELFVLPQCAPAGDLSPHLIYRKQAEAEMDRRRGLSRRQEIARRIANAVDDVLPAAQSAVKDRLIFRHTIARVDLPEHEPPASPFYETDSVRPIEMHVLRLGDVAMATNPFELYVDYATRIEARSPAVLTMLVQLASGSSGYLPTVRAVAGGGYSADKFVVGPAGGQVLVEQTLRHIQELW
jgi:hypothetical protein